MSMGQHGVAQRWGGDTGWQRVMQGDVGAAQGDE